MTSTFPRVGIVPKEETQAALFMKKHPEYNGRGVIIGIFDTGVDPGARGLQTTPEGLPKIVDMYDCTGSGDVDMTSIVRPLARGNEGDPVRLQGISGRVLTLPPHTCPSGEYRVGVKRAFDVFARDVVDRVKKKQKEQIDRDHEALLAAVEKESSAYREAHPSPTEEERKVQDDFAVRIAELQSLLSGYEDVGPMCDCVVFHDGAVWRALVDTTDTGDLKGLRPLANYRLERQFATFGIHDSLVNFGVNIFEDGAVLSIVADVGSHGTHVAGICAAYFPDEPELNGVAPGAQIVSLRIGDGRLGSMETGTGIARGVNAAVASGCHVINMSYGEAAELPDKGRVVNMLADAMRKHNIVFVSSAGNEGPGMNTAGAPGATTSGAIGVGAYVSPAMMDVEYSMRQRLPETQYTWSSRGPASDGAIGVSVVAPGGAIAPVPTWTLSGQQLMNGTSMSSPNCAGCVALLLSAMLHQQISYTPDRIRRALENTARRLPELEPFTQGSGLVQVDAAFEHVLNSERRRQSREGPAADYFPAYDHLRYKVVVGTDRRGVYLRDLTDSSEPHEVTVVVTPQFHQDTLGSDKVAFQLRVNLEATAPWVQCPPHLFLLAAGRNFEIRVDPTNLPHGAHFAEILAYDSEYPEGGPVFKIPITVIRPTWAPAEAGANLWRDRIAFVPGKVDRRFLAVPVGAQWATVTVRSLGMPADSSRIFYLQAIQAIPHRRFNGIVHDHGLRLRDQSEEVHCFRVTGGHTLEIATAQFWSSLGATDVLLEVSFSGILPDDSSEIVIAAHEAVRRVDVVNHLHTQTLKPKVTLESHQEVILPTSSDLHPLGSRDLVDGTRTHELILTYEFTQAKSGEVTARSSLLHDVLYESALEAQMLLFYDANKRQVGVQDAWPKAVTLQKGKHTIRLQVRHSSTQLLETLKQLPLSLIRPLSAAQNCGIHSTLADAVTLETKLTSKVLRRGARQPLFIVPPTGLAALEGVKPGDFLLGSLTLVDVTGAPTTKNQPKIKEPNVVRLVVPPRPAPKAEEKRVPSLDEAMRDLQVTHLGKMPRARGDGPAYDDTFRQLAQQYPRHVPLFSAHLERLASSPERAQTLGEIVDAAAVVLSLIDQTELAAHFGMRVPPDNAAAVARRREMEDVKKALVDALLAKAMALVEQAERNRSPDTLAAVADVYDALQRWIDPADAKMTAFVIARERLHGRLGAALRAARLRLEREPSIKNQQERDAILRELGWGLWIAQSEALRRVAYPDKFPPI